ncbi:MAG TPA: hypothetical protein VKQ29_08205 [Aliidongia sp.]|nr:hypothetical protein [Aliidongia sp.]
MEIVGSPPVLAGLRCEALICEGFICQGELVASANVVHLCFAGSWHKLVIDCGAIIWRQSDSIPAPWAVESEGWNYPHADVGGTAGVIGHRLQCYEMATTPNGGQVAFLFDNGRTIFIHNENDRSTFRIA